MKLTKYQHACMVLEEDGKKLIIDPGEFTSEFGELTNVAAVVITHVHGDHLHAGNIEKILTANPNIKVFATEEAVKELNNPAAQIVKAGDKQAVDGFTLSFFGELHNAVHSEWPQNQNVGVLVNNVFYYPGDSFTLPDTEIKLLAVPASAPWLKTGEAMDFVKTVKPRAFIRTHDGLFNQNGLNTNDVWFGRIAEKYGAEYRALKPGEWTEV